MATHHFSATIVWSKLGTFVQVAAGLRSVSVTLPAGGPATVVQDGVTQVGFLLADNAGTVTFTTTDIPTVVLDFGAGPLTLNSAEAISAGAASAAAAATSATAAAGSATAAAASATTAAATVTSKVDKGALLVNVKDYGATGNGATDDTTAILAAQTAAGFRPLYFPNGTYLCSASLTAQNIVGDNRQKTVLSYTGTGSAIDVPSAGVQSYHRRIEHLTIAGTSGTGLHLDCVSNGYFNNLLITGFTQAVWLRSTSGLPRQCLYNTFIDVNAENSGGYAWRLEDVANENRFISCRVNIAVRGFQIASGNRNVISDCSIENCSERGVSIPDPGSNGTRGTVVSATRFETNVNNITISSGVQMTQVLSNRFVDGTYTDNGTGTLLVDQSAGAFAAGRYATGSRPTALVAGSQIYDTTLGKPIWWNGTVWKDAAGTTV